MSVNWALAIYYQKLDKNRAAEIVGTKNTYHAR